MFMSMGIMYVQTKNVMNKIGQKIFFYYGLMILFLLSDGNRVGTFAGLFLQMKRNNIVIFNNIT